MASFSAARASRSPSSPKGQLSLDLSCIPPLAQPSPPSNTLLITELQALALFQPSSLDAIKSQLSAVAPLNSFSPLPSFRRIVCSFMSVDDAVRVRQLFDDGETVFGRNVRPKVYFGEHTPFEDEEGRKKKLLEAPQIQKLFFISPPPSPPHGWMLRQEDPPNKEVHASDLAEALERLDTLGEAFGAQFDQSADPDTPVSMSDVQMHGTNKDNLRTHTWPVSASRERSGSATIIYHPEAHGSNSDLPAVMVEDTSISADDLSPEMDISPIEQAPRRIIAHTTRPPVELIE
ncbi:hypothetical protein AJ80_02483 [Polytolypa hystricis UAMH7299]|uniref:Calcipressin n=1 Tax=Polytolypa hystricis (strain UAMH7299) TaxID=1447883 RepID=A0A2B7YR69_POLH7|nr:hypothetical protein AJ80_02483 [Polytolypa hystricis UAMH7299]